LNGKFQGINGELPIAMFDSRADGTLKIRPRIRDSKWQISICECHDNDEKENAFSYHGEMMILMVTIN